ncbi:hypothetical protein DV096_13400 [Bradymonadaceae bacterium TMQ3]|uniref:Uncharacterized protein n=1 Tax=Lujinxingia sediminis TaxID=2480984 RepID=A0ABY0CU18_9DELT|nr:hypothetical protein [Lujinxingia sediminis]RDV37503.1 hypothetical protein DV096_13400 [Bradymonadaceae bacterium TMQ3]RVU45808.1 hypothetical protein EA187_08595 [Lujinxingia sediminis]TXC75059.1 hypothetical protein FRC91_13295 [Bradymonadales bacterium TMQ1]
MSSPAFDAPLNLRKDRACIDDLLWRLDLPEDTDLTRLPDALREVGLTRRGQASSLPMWVFFSAEDHRLLVVPATGRLQLRVHYATPRDTRRNAARALAEQVARALAAC